MKLLKIFTPVITLLGVVSCSSEISVADQYYLNKTGMSFNTTGAEFGECGLVSQFERGRASSSQSAGGG